MRTHALTPPSHRLQRGVALVVGMIMLLVLTILAIAGMGTANLEFLMSGNEQFRSRAFNAAEAGIAQAIATGGMVAAPGWTQTVAGTVPGAGTDTYSAAIDMPLGATPINLSRPGFSANTFVTYHFRITSTGTSARNSQALHVQEVADVAKNDPSTQNCLSPPCAL